MLYNTLHNRVLRLVLAVLGELIAAAALNLFIVPLSLYTGGLMGLCQLIRTLLQAQLGLELEEIAAVYQRAQLNIGRCLRVGLCTAQQKQYIDDMIYNSDFDTSNP